MSRSTGRNGPVQGRSVRTADTKSFKIDIVSYKDFPNEEDSYSCASAVITSIAGRNFLITNLHNFTGAHLWTGKLLDSHGGRRPHRIKLWCPSSEEDQVWTPHLVEIFRTPGSQSIEDKLWVEHPLLGSHCDLAALPLPRQLKFAEESILDIEPGNSKMDIADPVSIIGFPFGKSGRGSRPCWTSGTIAHDPSGQIEGGSFLTLPDCKLPIYLVDSRTRPGQSGAPVWRHRVDYTGIERLGRSSLPAAPVLQLQFIGIYSGRLHSDADLGVVWTKATVAELAEFAAAKASH